jgi:uncharacterized protein YcfJ
MFSRVLTLSVLLGSIAVAPAALADHEKYRNARYDSSAPRYDFARVVDVQPIVRTVRVEVPERECWDEERYEEPRGHRDGLAGPMILGGLIGGAIGTRIGDGDGRRAATVAGALIGSAIGHDVAARRQAERAAAPPRVYTVERCDVRYTHRVEERIDGYDVEYEYSGERYRTQLPYDPGDRIRIRVDVSPAERY